MNDEELKVERYREWMRSEGHSISRVWTTARKLGLPLVPFEFWSPWAVAFCQLVVFTLLFAVLIYFFGWLLAIAAEDPFQIVRQTLAVNLGVNTGAAWRTKNNYERRKIPTKWETF